MKKIQLVKRLTLLLLLISCGIFAQSSIHAAGGNGSGSGGSISYSVGQVNDQFVSGTSGNITQGVQQSFEVLVTQVNELTPDLQINVFPNPSSEWIKIETPSPINKAVNIILYDLSGKIILTKPLNQQSMQISISELACSEYLLRLSDDKNKTLKTYQIIKY
ncbi:MAG: T9SS type A sorting domain-containing protein [Sphingobacterium thalpophilum]|jgi:hypothetical protein